MAERPIDRLKRIPRDKAAPPGTTLDVKERRESMENMAFKVKDDIQVETLTVATCDAEWVRAPGIQDDRAILYLHGGGYVIGSPHTHRSIAGEISRATQAAVECPLSANATSQASILLCRIKTSHLHHNRT